MAWSTKVWVWPTGIGVDILEISDMRGQALRFSLPIRAVSQVLPELQSALLVHQEHPHSLEAQDEHLNEFFFEEANKILNAI